MKGELENILQKVKEKLGGLITSSEVSLGDLVIYTSRDNILKVCEILKNDEELRFEFLSDLTVVDWLDIRDDRFEVVYHLRSFKNNEIIRIKVPVPEDDPKIPSVISLWKSADFLESEAWDMFGVIFEGNKDLRRMLMYDEFEGHPLRKDYPVQGKQPRVAMRHPEVRNTAVDLHRPNLVKINKKKKRGLTRTSGM